MNKAKLLSEIGRNIGRKEISAAVSILQRWVAKVPNRSFILRMYQESSRGVFIENDEGGDKDKLADLVETFLFDEHDPLHEVVQEQLKLGNIEQRKEQSK